MITLERVLEKPSQAVSVTGSVLSGNEASCQRHVNALASASAGEGLSLCEFQAVTSQLRQDHHGQCDRSC
jgi:hypothetical protein